MSRTSRLVLHGAIAGILAASVLAVWFLLLDWAAGHPLHTPAFLASALLNTGTVSTGFATIALYTVFHYAAFIILGILLALLLGSVPLGGGILFGAVAGFLLFDFLFYAGILSSGTNVIRALGWPQVLAGTVIAGMVMLGYLSGIGPVRSEGWLQRMSREPTVREGFIAGLIGATAVAIWFLIVDAIAGSLLYTPAALGSALFFGATSPAQVQVDFGTIAGYTLLHYTAFVIVGIVAAAVVHSSEKSPPLVLAGLLVFVTTEALFVGLVALAANWILGTLAWWAVAVGNVVGAVAMGLYLWNAHPMLHHRLNEPLEDPV